MTNHDKRMKRMVDAMAEEKQRFLSLKESEDKEIKELMKKLQELEKLEKKKKKKRYTGNFGTKR